MMKFAGALVAIIVPAIVSPIGVVENSGTGTRSGITELRSVPLPIELPNAGIAIVAGVTVGVITAPTAIMPEADDAASDSEAMIAACDCVCDGVCICDCADVCVCVCVCEAATAGFESDAMSAACACICDGVSDCDDVCVCDEVDI